MIIFAQFGLVLDRICTSLDYSVVLLGFGQMQGKIMKILADLSENTLKSDYFITILHIKIQANFQLPQKKSISPIENLNLLALPNTIQ
jgi:hypothetical protein